MKYKLYIKIIKSITCTHVLKYIVLSQHMLISNISCLTRLSFIFHWVVFFRALQLMFKNKFTYGQLNHILNIRCMGGRGGGVREIQQDTHSSHSEIPLTVLTCLSLTLLCVSLTFLCVLDRPNYDFLLTTKQKCKILLSKKNILTMQRNKKSTTAWWVYCSIFDYGVILNNSNFYFVSKWNI